MIWHIEVIIVCLLNSQNYMKSFTLAIQRECSKYGISVQLVTPWFVRTKLVNFSSTLMAGGILFPDVESYVKSAIYTVGKSSETTGYWAHGIQYAIIKIVPTWVRTIVAEKIGERFRDEYFAQQEIQDVK